MKITFIQAGGTIDKGYPENSGTHGYNFEIGEPAFASILEKFKPKFEYDSMTVVRKDSLDLTDDDREQIFKAVQGCNEKRIVITHGTDTIAKTAERLSEIKDKIIVLTGAMLPSEFSDSDAEFNVGIATGAVQSIEAPGVYIALYGLVVPWHEYTDV
jgi:L-asparaginase